MKVRAKNIFTTIRSEGAMLPVDLLQRVVENDKNLDGLMPADYHLLEDEKLNEAVSRSWSRMRGAWVGFRGALEMLPLGDVGTKVTRDRFLLPLFQELGYGRLAAAKSLELGDKSFPISHGWQNTPIHLVGYGVELDKRTKGVAGAARSSPHSLVQECLNRSDAHLWALVSNGRRLRILRDNASLTRQAYVEFDLEAMMDGEVYADFVLLWLLCHQSRVEATRPEKCWLERWSKAANDQGKRALEDLRGGVQTAIERLGQGFLSHAANKALREKLYSGELSTQDYYRQLLRLVYRLLFLFVAEDRELLLDPAADEAARDRYRLYYSTVKLRALAEKRRGSRHGDLFMGLRLVMEKLGSAEGCPEIGLPALGSFLWSAEAVVDLLGHPVVGKTEDDLEQLELGEDDGRVVEPCQIANADLLDAVRVLAFINDKHGRRPVDYKNLQSEELGSVYESLLELHPELNRGAGTFVLETASGNERKTTGSYYTPDSLVQCLLDSALNPVLEDAALKPDAEAAILALKVCDPACGSGHFLIAAAHRMAKRLAFVRTGDEEPSPMEVQRALRDVIGRCVYGVDINPMAVELCKVALWMEALEPGKPLSFLDHHIQCGNSLIGATPALLRKGIPDEAFKPIEGDDKEYCKKYKKQNKEERKGQMKLFDPDRDNMPWQQLGNLAVSMTRLVDIADNDIAGIERKREQYEEMVVSTPYLYSRFLADSWCAAFMCIKTSEFAHPITENIFREIEKNPHSASKRIRSEVERLREDHRYFHWHLAFPDVFQVIKKNPDNVRCGWDGGFDALIGNPPWEKLQTEELQFFAIRAPELAKLKGSTRKNAISKLKEDNPELLEEWISRRRFDAAAISFIRNSGIYPLTGVGKFNTFALFAEMNTSTVRSTGSVGCIIPSSIATDDTTKFFFQEIIEKGSLVSLFDFENREGIFQGVHRSYKFCLITLVGEEKANNETAIFVFFARSVSDVNSDNVFKLSAEDIRLINPNTQTCPVFRSSKDARLAKQIHLSGDVLVRENRTDADNPWFIHLQRMFNMTDDSYLFKSTDEVSALEKKEIVSNRKKIESSYVGLYESKMFHLFDHRWNTDDKKATTLAEPRYYIGKEHVDKFLQGIWKRKWLFAWRDITNATNERTLITHVLPYSGVGHTAHLIFPQERDVRAVMLLLANFSTFVLDYIARLKVGGTHVTHTHLKQLPVVSSEDYKQMSFAPKATVDDFVSDRVFELTYTAWDLQSFAEDYGYNGPPFRWNESRRFLLRCELDAAYFHLYNIQRGDVDYIMETFPIVKRKDEKAHGHYRTKTTILSIYDAMTTAIQTGQPYQTLLDPPPADPSMAHPPRPEDSV